MTTSNEMKEKKTYTFTKKEEDFCQKVLELWKSTGQKKLTDAYRHAYSTDRMTVDCVHQRAYELAKKPKIRKRLEEIEGIVRKKINLKISNVVDHWVKIATTDVNELVQLQRNCCRYCFGENHAYQWVDHEYALACARACDNNKTPPTCEGGLGFNVSLDPNPDCPYCFGEGVERVFQQDTRKLSAAAKTLYNGVKKTKFGPEVMIRDRDRALENLAKFLGAFSEKPQEQKIPINLNLAAADANEAAKIYQTLMKQ